MIMPHHSSRRALLPIVLIALGLYLLVGCIYIPMFGRTTDGKNVRRAVGDANSRRPLRVSRASRDDVLRVLGPPYVAASDGSALAYTWRVQNGIAIWPFCFMADSIDGMRTLVLRFDQAGKLQSYNLMKSDKPLISLGAMWFQPPLPDDLRDELAAQKNPLSSRPTGRPASPPSPTTPPSPPPGPTYKTPASP